MNRGGRKTQWLPKDPSSSINVENGSRVSKWSHLATQPNASYKPRSGEGAPVSVEDQTGDQDKITGSSQLLNLGNKQEQASSQETTHINGNQPFFDIFKTGNVFQLKAPLHLKNRVKRQENKFNTRGPTIQVLRPGMFLLKHYISVADQVSIVHTCRKFGMSPAGFYEPANRGGIGTLSRKMMILGKFWDHENNKYVDESPIDGTKPHSIPGEFTKFAYQAIRDSHDHLRKQSVRNIEKTLPPLTPDICVVNFYSKSGRLGLHRDKNESEESLRRGLPVVSISIGDSAEFVYGDQGDIEKAEKVVLESGDMLIFGGSSRLVYHGVTVYMQRRHLSFCWRKQIFAPDA